MDELAAWLTLVRAPGLHAGTLRPLLSQLPSAASILGASPTALHAAGASAALIAWINERRIHDVSADLRWLEHEQRRFITLNDPRYPQLLAELPDAPIALYVRGCDSLLALPQLAMVGSRNPTPAGRENATDFAAHLTRCGLTITSGLAIGIDSASHQGALAAGGETIAVCGTGLDIAYPRSNSSLADAIAAKGALVSEFPPGTPAIKSNFPRRNRIISGLSLGVLVVEAALRSGSLITARLASEQGREVFAIPGSIHNALARGCHQLIRQGATLVESADDIFAELRALASVLTSPSSGLASRARQRTTGAALDKEYEILLDALGFEPARVDDLVVRSGLGADAVASMLLILELEGRIESYPGGLYVQRAHTGSSALKAAK
jgi:DNA processing protein